MCHHVSFIEAQAFVSVDSIHWGGIMRRLLICRIWELNISNVLFPLILAGRELGRGGQDFILNPE